MGPERSPALSSAEEPWSRAAVASLALLLLGASASLAWLVHPYYDFTMDSAIYLLTARSILAGEGYSYLGEPFVLRPPGFPALLLPALGLFGTSFWVLNLYVSLFGVLCSALLFAYLRPRVGTAVAFAAAAAIWLNPPFRRWSAQVMSDVPGAALMLACLVLERWARRDPFPRRDLVLGLSIAAASYVRSLNVFLVPAIVLGRWLDREGAVGEGVSWRPFALRRALLVCVVPALALLPWAVRDTLRAPPAPAEQTRDYSYWVAMWHTDRADPLSPLVEPGEVLERIPERLGEIVPLIGSRMQSNEPTPLHLALGTTGLVCWLLAAARRRGAGEIFVGLALLALSIYFALVLRLLLPVYLLVLCAVAEGAVLALGRLGSARIARACVALLLSLLALHDLDLRPGWSYLARRHDLYLRLGERLASAFPPETPLAAVDGAPLSVYLDRPVYNLRPALEREGVAGALEVLRRRRVGAAAIPITEPELLSYLTERYGAQERIGPIWIVRIGDPGLLGAGAGPPRGRP